MVNYTCVFIDGPKQHAKTSGLSSCVMEKDLAAEKNIPVLFLHVIYTLETCLALLNNKRQC